MPENVLSRRRWVPWSYELGGATVTCELKRMDALEAADFKINLADAFATVRDLFKLRIEMATFEAPPAGAPPEATTAFDQISAGYMARIQKADAQFFKALDRPTISRVLSECVRNVGGLGIEGETAGGETFLMDPDLLKAILIELRRLTELTAMEGKASSSPSTSVSEASEPPSTVSPVPFIEIEGSTPPSTVPETLAETA